MLLGKRPRPPIRRTTSMTGITVDPSNMEGEEPAAGNSVMMMDVHAPPAPVVVPDAPVNTIYYNNGNSNGNTSYYNNGNSNGSLGYHEQHRFLAMLSPRNNNTTSHGRNTASDVVETAHFLRTCGLCNRRLASGRDIYMYRGDTAFCSLECREQQMKQDERLEKCKGAASNNEVDRHATRSSNSKASSVAAA